MAEAIIVGGLVVTGIALAVGASINMIMKAKELEAQMQRDQQVITPDPTPQPPDTFYTPSVLSNLVMQGVNYSTIIRDYHVLQTAYTSQNKIPAAWTVVQEGTVMTPPFIHQGGQQVNNYQQVFVFGPRVITSSNILTAVVATIYDNSNDRNDVNKRPINRGGGVLDMPLPVNPYVRSPTTSSNSTNPCCDVVSNITDEVNQKISKAVIDATKEFMKYGLLPILIAKLMTTRIEWIPARNEWTYDDFVKYADGTNNAPFMNEEDKMREWPS